MTNSISHASESPTRKLSRLSSLEAKPSAVDLFLKGDDRRADDAVQIEFAIEFASNAVPRRPIY